jgi:hypothetical protein
MRKGNFGETKLELELASVVELEGGWSCIKSRRVYGCFIDAPTNPGNMMLESEGNPLERYQTSSYLSLEHRPACGVCGENECLRGTSRAATGKEERMLVSAASAMPDAFLYNLESCKPWCN